MQTNRHFTPDVFPNAAHSGDGEIAMTQIEPGVWQFLWHEFSAWQEVHVSDRPSAASPTPSLNNQSQPGYALREVEVWHTPLPLIQPQESLDTLPTQSQEPDRDYLDPFCQAFVPIFPFDSTPSGLPSDRPSTLNLPIMGWRAGVATGVAIAMTTGAIAHIAHQNPSYEGSFRLSVAAPQSASNQETPATPTILAPETQAKILESPRLIDPVVERLNAQSVDTTYAELTDRLEISLVDEQIEVRYQDADPETVRRVLDQLAHTYVNYSQECRDRACRGIRFIETQLPHVQQRVNTLQDEIQQFRQTNGIEALQTQGQEFSQRANAVSQQGSEVAVQLAEARQRQAMLQQKLSLQRDETIALQILNSEPRYHNLLYQLRSNDQAIATEISRLQIDPTQLQALYTQHQQLMAQMQAVAAQALPAYLARPATEANNPILREPVYQEPLQEAIATAQTIQVLEIRQETIAQTKTLLQEQHQQLVALLRQEAELQQELQTEVGIVEQYVDKIAELRSQTAPPIAWQLVSPPEVIETATLAALVSSTDAQRQLGIAALLGILTGVGVASTLAGQAQGKRVAKPTPEEPETTQAALATIA